jgi:hypothetical protein
MIAKILMVSLLLSQLALAQENPLRNSDEEAIILNQELQYLEETADNVSIPNSGRKTSQDSAQPLNKESLEQRYFGEDQDTVSNRAASPRRRRATNQ